ncbi:MAG TPA: T9SS type A sorting domain-containing protein [Candidatus Marinimicrobia bacterium]|nr:T9SS type A sorting domain-containing protein [Candidatus Neomarinimicrobiota bacterium]
MPWSNVGSVTSYTLTGLSLDQGVPYYASVRAVDMAGNISEIASGDGITIDQQGPLVGEVSDGDSTDVDWININYQITSNWSGFTDTLSGIAYYELSVGLNLGETQVVNWTSAGLDSGLTVSVSLNEGPTYYVNVRATDAVGNLGDEASSDGFGLDVSNPVAGTVIDGTDSDVDWTSSTTTLSAAWSGFSDAYSGIEYYEYAVGTTSGGTNVIEWTDVDSTTDVTNDELDLENEVTYFVSVRATDLVDNVSDVATTDGVTVDTIPPVISAVYEGTADQDEDYQGSDTTFTIGWEGSDDASGIAQYEYTVGSTLGDSDVVAWSDAGLATEAFVTSLSLSEGVTYFASVRAYDSAGNISEVLSGDGITIDLTPPALGTVIDGTTEDAAFTGSLNTLIASWTDFSDNLSGIQFYEYAVGTSPGTTDIKEWTPTGLDTSVTDASFTLVDEQAYYVSIRATDNVDNVSGSVTTDGITADHTGPDGYWAVDGDSTDIDRQNYTDHYQGYWSLFTDGTSGLNRHEYALYDITDADYYLLWTDAGLDTSVVLTGLELTVDHVYQLQVRGVDSVENIGPTVISDGVLVDQSAPVAPQNLVGFFSSERIRLIWDPSPEEDFAFYTVYAGTEPEPTTAVLQIESSEAEAFVEGFQDGAPYYLRVTATDIPGNEGAFSDELMGIPQLAAITRMTPDTSVTLDASDQQITVHFSQPLTSAGTASITSLAYPSMTVQSVYSEVDTSIVVTISDPYASLDTLTLTMSGITDWAGNVTSDKVLSFTTYLLADYNSDFAVDVTDLADFISSWTNSDFSYELGPVSGSVPHLIPTQDGIYDLRDIMTFTRMWNWYHQSNLVQFLARESFGPHLEFQQSGRDLLFAFPAGAVAGQVLLQYPQSTADVELIAGEFSEDRIMLSRKSVETGTILAECGYFTTNGQRYIGFTAESANRHDLQFLVSYLFLEKDGQFVSGGTMHLDVKAVPETYALYQNYPNPFNPVTTILYDLPENAYVNLMIYDILGRSVRSLVSVRQEAGYYSVQWPGKDGAGNLVGAGVYIYHLQAGSYSKTRKMILLK